MDTRGKEWSSALNMPNAFAALHANITADGSRGVERSNQAFAIGILNECWQAYTLIRDGMDPGGALPREVVRPGSAAMRLIADVYTTFNTRADTRRAEGTEMGLKCIQLPRSRPAGEPLTGDSKRLRAGPAGIPADPAVAGAQFIIIGHSSQAAIAPGAHGLVFQTTTMTESSGKRTDGVQHRQWQRRSEHVLEPHRPSHSDQQHRLPVQAAA